VLSLQARAARAVVGKPLGEDAHRAVSLPQRDGLVVERVVEFTCEVHLAFSSLIGVAGSAADAGAVFSDATRFLRERFESQKPARFATAVLLRKTIPEAMNTPCEFVGFDIPDEFVVGCGLDYDGCFRNLPDVRVLHPEGSAS
jgi:hypothetical protein